MLAAEGCLCDQVVRTGLQPQLSPRSRPRGQRAHGPDLHGRCARFTRRRFEQPFYLLTKLMISWNSGLMAGVDMRHVGHFCVLAASCFVLAATALVLYLMVGSWLP